MDIMLQVMMYCSLILFFFRDIPMAQFAMTAANIGTLLGGICGVS